MYNCFLNAVLYFKLRVTWQRWNLCRVFCSIKFCYEWLWQRLPLSWQFAVSFVTGESRVHYWLLGDLDTSFPKWLCVPVRDETRLWKLFLTRAVPAYVPISYLNVTDSCRNPLSLPPDSKPMALSSETNYFFLWKASISIEKRKDEPTVSCSPTQVPHEWLRSCVSLKMVLIAV